MRGTAPGLSLLKKIAQLASGGGTDTTFLNISGDGPHTTPKTAPDPGAASVFKALEPGVFLSSRWLG
jgi:hypothetical protein